MEQLDNWIARHPIETFPRFSWDIETTNLNPYPEDVCGHCLAFTENEAVYIPTGHINFPEMNLDHEAVWERVLNLVKTRQTTVYNYKFEGRVLRRKGLDIKIGWDKTLPIIDGIIVLWLYDSDRKTLGLKDATHELLGIDTHEITEVPLVQNIKPKKPPKPKKEKYPPTIKKPSVVKTKGLDDEQINTAKLANELETTLYMEYLTQKARCNQNHEEAMQEYELNVLPAYEKSLKLHEDLKARNQNVNFHFSDPRLATAYAAADPVTTLRLLNKTLPVVESEQGFILNLEHRLLRTLLAVEDTGIATDQEFLKASETNLKHWIEFAKQEIYAEAGTTFDINSPKVIGELLTSKGIQVPLTDKGNLQVNKKVLEDLAFDYPFCRRIVRYRNIAKEYSTYILPLQIQHHNGIIYLKFNQTKTTTGRLSSGGKLKGDPFYCGLNAQNLPRQSTYFTSKARLLHGSIPEVEQAIRGTMVDLRLLAEIEEQDGS